MDLYNIICKLTLCSTSDYEHSVVFIREQADSRSCLVIGRVLFLRARRCGWGVGCRVCGVTAKLLIMMRCVVL